MTSQEEDTTWDPDHLRRRLQSMDDFDFEHLVADIWEAQEWNTDVEQQSVDAGVDIRATQSSPYNRKSLIQAKRYSDDNPIGGPDIQQYSALKQQEPDADESIIVTTGRFTGSAEDRAQDLNVKLIDGDNLVSLIDDLNAYDIVEEYIGQPAGGGSRPRSGPDRDEGFTSDDQQELEQIIGKDLDEYQQEDKYRATRALERAQDRVSLNPYDAERLGVFDDLPMDDVDKRFTEEKERLVFLKDDIHCDDNGEIYVEDLTDYIGSSAIEGDKREGIVGLIERGVQDGAWASDSGESRLKRKKQAQWVKRTAEDLYSKIEDSDVLTSDTTDSKGSQWKIRESDVETKTPETSNSQSTISDGEGQIGNQREASERLSSHQTSVDVDLDQSVWYYGVIAGTAGWLLAWLMAASLPEGMTVLGSLIALVTLISWIVLPIALFMDTRETGIFATTKKKSLAYVILSVIPIFAVIPGAVYLYRERNLGS